jgi:hypothetical protein
MLLDLYVDGVLVGSETRAALLPASSNFIIGNTGHASGEQWDGIIAAVAVSDGVLGPDTFVLTRSQQAIPEPSTFALAGLGLLWLGFFGRRWLR